MKNKLVQDRVTTLGPGFGSELDVWEAHQQEKVENVLDILHLNF